MSEELSPADQKAVQALLIQRKEESRWVGLVSRKPKAEKTILVVGCYRLFMLKPGGKLEKDAHMLEIAELNSPNGSEVFIKFRTWELGMAVDKADDLVNAIRTAHATAFPEVPEELAFKVNVQPASRLEALPKAAGAPSGRYSTTYQAMCEAYGVPCRLDICWDMDNFYPSSHVTAFNLRDFEQPISAGDLKALLGALQFNGYFLSFVSTGMPLKECMPFIAEMLRYNRTIETVVITGGSTPGAIGAIADGLAQNRAAAVNRLDFSDNPIDEKGATSLANALGRLQHGLVELSLARAGMNPKSMAALAQGLRKNVNMAAALTTIDLSDNKLEAEGTSPLAAYLSTPNALQTLRLGNTAANLETLIGALIRGCPELRVIDISGCKLTKKETPQLVKYIQASSNLSELRIADSGITPELLRDVLKALAANPYLQKLNVDLSRNKFGVVGANLLGKMLNECPNVESIDLTENDFGDEGLQLLFDGLCENFYIRSLRVGRNFKAKNDKVRAQVIDSLINLISQDGSVLRDLHLEGGGLQAAIIPFLLALGTNDSLHAVDVSGHKFGNKGASALGKALQTNRTLRSIVWEDNGATLPGFQAVKAGLDRNFVVTDMVLPILDVAAAFQASDSKANPRTLQQTLSDIERAINRNQAPKAKFAAGVGGGGSGGAGGGVGNLAILSSGERSEVERLRFKIKSTGRKPTEAQAMVLKEAENNDAVIASFHMMEDEVQQATQDMLQQKLQALAAEITPIIQRGLENLAKKLVNTAGEKYKGSMEPDQLRRLGTNMTFGAKEIKREALDAIFKSAAVDIGNLAHETFTSAVDITSDYCFEKLQEQLEGILDDITAQQEEAAASRDSSSSSSSSTSMSGSASSLPAHSGSSSNLTAGVDMGTPTKKPERAPPPLPGTAPGPSGKPPATPPPPIPGKGPAPAATTTTAAAAGAKSPPEKPGKPVKPAKPAKPAKPTKPAATGKPGTKATAPKGASVLDSATTPKGEDHTLDDPRANRPMIQRKRRPPTRRPRAPANDE